MKGFKQGVELIRDPKTRAGPLRNRLEKGKCPVGGTVRRPFSIIAETRAAWSKVGHGPKGLEAEQFRRKC